MSSRRSGSDETRTRGPGSCRTRTEAGHSFGSLAIQQFDLVAVKDMMGHSKLTTTERYLH
jgi:hypothetical protein